jgi:hypothetical protein
MQPAGYQAEPVMSCGCNTLCGIENMLALSTAKFRLQIAETAVEFVKLDLCGPTPWRRDFTTAFNPEQMPVVEKPDRFRPD